MYFLAVLLPHPCQIIISLQTQSREQALNESVKDEKVCVISPFRPRVITKREPESKLPMPFELPRNYPAMVMTDLEKGMLTVKGKTKFISSVAAAIFRFKSFPEKHEYEHVGQVIISKYPFLKSSSGTGYVSTYIFMHACM